MEIKVITQLARIMNRTDLTEIQIEDEKAGLKIRLKRGEPDGTRSTPIVNVTQGATALPIDPSHLGQIGGAGLAAHAPGPAVGAAAAGGAAALPPGTVEFKSPLVGTFYRASSPESAPFVEIGSSVSDGGVLCVVEAMKVMNEIESDMDGTIVEILVENAEPVEFGQPLFLIKRG